MIRVVYDCNVILSGIGWNGSARTCLVTYDKDLLDLDKPFGIATIRPAEFLRRIRA